MSGSSSKKSANLCHAAQHAHSPDRLRLACARFAARLMPTVSQPRVNPNENVTKSRSFFQMIMLPNGITPFP
jgi:hypothetical protein